MFIDELVDSGMDSSGAESSLAVLKHTAREMNKNIFLIRRLKSYKDKYKEYSNLFQFIVKIPIMC